MEQNIKKSKITDELLEEKFKELLYDFGEVNWGVLSDQAWDDYIEKDKKFNDNQLKDLRDFLEGVIDELNQAKPIKQRCFIVNYTAYNDDGYFEGCFSVETEGEFLNHNRLIKTIMDDKGLEEVMVKNIMELSKDDFNTWIANS